MHRAAVVIQSRVRGYLQRKKYLAVRTAIVAIQARWRAKVVRQQIWEVSAGIWDLWAMVGRYRFASYLSVSSRTKDYYCAKVHSRLFGTPTVPENPTCGCGHPMLVSALLGEERVQTVEGEHSASSSGRASNTGVTFFRLKPDPLITCKT